jgi:F-type H+-transporting ATPase subunit delta
MADTKKPDEFAEPVDIGMQNVAAAYAKALFHAAEKAGALDAVVADLEAVLDEIVAKIPKLVDLLVSDLFSPESKMSMIDRVLKGKVHPLLLNFFKVLAAHDRSYVLRSIREELRKLYEKARGRVPVKIVTAAPLTAAQQSAVVQRMKSVLGGDPILRTEVDPSLIGGLVAQVGDVVFDGSLASNLARLREQLINRSVHEIQRRRDRVSTTAGN